GAMLYPVMRPSKIASPSLVTWLRLDWLRIRSLSASVNVWLRVGFTIGAVFSKNSTVYVFIPSGMDPPVKPYLTPQPFMVTTPNTTHTYLIAFALIIAAVSIQVQILDFT